MAQKTIRILIEELEQNGEKYYFGSSPDVSGFLLETDTLEEAIKIAPEIMKNLLEAKRDRLVSKHKPQRIQNTKFSLNYTAIGSLQLAQ